MPIPSLPSFHATDPAFVLDPHGGRVPRPDAAPIAHIDDLDAWAVLRHDDVAALLRDPSYRKDPANARPGPYTDVIHATMPTMLNMDDPDHRRLRGLVAQAFTRRTSDALRPQVRRLADELLDQLAAIDEPVDVVAGYTGPLPVIVIAEIIGVDPADRDQFKRWSNDIALQFDPLLAPDDAARIAGSIEQMHAYLAESITQRRRDPRDDLISALIAAQETDGSVLTEDEAVRVLRLLLAAGNITTTDLIGNAIVALLQHPDQLDALRAEPELVDNAVEETLRFDPPVVATERIPTTDVTIAGCPITSGEWVMPIFTASNRDPSANPDPDRFDIRRDRIRHHSFGGGPHLCLGAPLARMEAQVAIGALVERFPDIRIAHPDAPIEYRYTPGFRGPAALHVVLGTSNAHSHSQTHATASNRPSRTRTSHPRETHHSAPATPR